MFSLQFAVPFRLNIYIYALCDFESLFSSLCRALLDDWNALQEISNLAPASGPETNENT